MVTTIVLYVSMIPGLIKIPGSPWPVLPQGLHFADLGAVANRFATNPWRRSIFDGLIDGVRNLLTAGCTRIFLDGSYVTGKPKPQDFDACWDPTGVDSRKLDPVFLDFSNQRATQKARFKGEFFPSSMISIDVGQSFVDFFQVDRYSGHKKGMVVIDLPTDPMLQPQVMP